MQSFNLEDLTHHELYSKKSGEKFSHSAILSHLVGFKDLFVHHEILPPGRRASSPHRHSKREEMIFVLEGNPLAHIGDKKIPLKPGDFFGFKPQTSELHHVSNPTKSEVKFLVIASREQDDVQYE